MKITEQKIFGNEVDKSKGLMLISQRNCEILLEALREMHVEGVASSKKKALLEHSVYL